MSTSTLFTSEICSSCCALDASTTCSSKSAWIVPSSVARNAAISEGGRSRRNPTVSETTTCPAPSSHQRSVHVSNAANTWSVTYQPARYPALTTIDLPALSSLQLGKTP